MNTYKIGLISTHGTGKTTLSYIVAGELKKRGLKVKPITEIATQAIESGIPINKNTTLEAQAWILHKQCQLELEADIYKYEVAICDRTVIDNYVYLEKAVGRKQEYLQMILNHLQLCPYNRIYLLPMTIKPIADGVRELDTAFQTEIHNRLLMLLNEFKIKYIELPKPKEEDEFRAEWIDIIVDQTAKDLGKRTITEFVSL